MKKNKFKLFGIIAAVAVIGFSMAACEVEVNSGGGGRGVPAALLGVWEPTGGGTSFEIVLDSDMYGGVALRIGDGGSAIEARGNSIYHAGLRFRMFDFELSNNNNTLTVSNTDNPPYSSPPNGTYTRRN